MGRLDHLTEHLSLYHSAVTVGVIRDGDGVVLVDCDDAAVVDELAETHGLRVERAVFTHYHRDSAGGAGELARRGVDVIVPAAEREYFEDVASFWADPGFRFRRYESFRPHRLLLARPVSVADTIEPGETIRWGEAAITARPTPGHTAAGLSYRVDVDGERSVFTGDAICADGRLWDAYSLQRSTGERTDYHSFLGDRDRLLEGLEALVDADPDRFVPLRGRPVDDPAAAVDRLGRRLRAAYRNYAGIAALRYYFPETFAGEEPSGAMPIREGIDPPDPVEHVETSWILRSADGPALLVDCGSPAVLDRIETRIRSGRIDGIDGLWISHYHFDHVDAVSDFRETYDDVPILTQAEVADVVERPAAHRLPVLAADPVPVDRPLADGETWEWREWTLTARWLPGQTYYHGGLVAERDDLCILFAGDAFTPAGLDDYCTLNRNLLGSGGFDRCLRLVEEIDPTHVLNCHVDPAFDFTPGELHTMRERLAERIELFDALLAWEHPDFGLDPNWIRCDPYHQTLSPGDRGRIDVVATNHAAEPRTVTVRPRLPSVDWRLRDGRDASDPRRVRVDPGAEVAVACPFRVPGDATPGETVFTIDVAWGTRQLPRFRAAIVAVSAP